MSDDFTQHHETLVNKEFQANDYLKTVTRAHYPEITCNTE